MQGSSRFRIINAPDLSVPIFSKRYLLFTWLNQRDRYARMRLLISCLEVRLWQLFQYCARTKQEVRRHNVT